MAARRRVLRSLVPVVLAAAVTAPSAVARSEPVVGRLKLGGHVFWTDAAPRASSTVVPDCTGCELFAIVLTEPGARLRVAGESPSGALVHVYDAAGGELASGSGSISAEAYVASPAAGRYYVRMLSGGSRFRMRAKLERPAVARTGSQPLLPNLRLLPPYGFDARSGCNAYEMVEYAARRCLRFALGPANHGPGPLMLRIPTTDGLVVPGPVFQRIRHADGTTSERRAGEAQFHKTHAHYHHNGFGSLELLAVTDRRTGALRKVGTGPKQGFCMIDWAIADWWSFANDQAGSVRQDCSLVPADRETILGLSAGWTDIYTNDLDGNYVELGSNGDGYYLVRSTTDAEGVVLETNERDNTSYAYIRLSGTTVAVLERGYGASPWDPRKQVADDLLPPVE